MFVKEWPIELFKHFYPDYMPWLINHGVDPNDNDYIARVEYREDGSVNQIEVGYVSDKWYLEV